LYAAWFNIGVSFAREGNHLKAAIAYSNALALRPDTHGAAINLGLLFEATGQPEQALATWKRAAQPDEARIALEIQQGRLLEKLGRFDEAERVLRRVLLTDPAQPDVIHHWVHIRQKSCMWPVAPSDIPGVSAAVLVRSSGPLGILALTDDIDLQREAAAAWVARKTKPALRRMAPAVPYPHQRIRIGYMSSDFCSHAMSYLITELFERHDRNRFEVFGYCSSQDDGTELRKRVLAAFDQHRIIRTMSDEQAAQTIRDDEIDVLIDLNGITDGSRLHVLRWRPAPIQATYLGFIGPIPMPELDYLLCDNVVIPPEYETAYQPKPLPIAQIYQANDSKRTVGRPLSRVEAGLPEDSFVFCGFSKHYKITEEMFAAWMSILRQTDRTVIWLAKDNPYSEANMLAAASRAGVAEERIIFSERADPDLYLRRLGAADLFLDTFPYNAGTVASDAIRMRLPLLTLCGKAFASRMATSLLYSMGAREGITTSLPKYVDTAIRLANDPAAYARFKILFTEQAWSRTIGDIESFTKEYEETWCRIVHDTRAT
jgi:predicted O-linked N-acetylglucosamine transferase (SPINDLY family)